MGKVGRTDSRLPGAVPTQHGESSGLVPEVLHTVNADIARQTGLSEYAGTISALYFACIFVLTPHLYSIGQSFRDEETVIDARGGPARSHAPRWSPQLRDQPGVA